MSFASAFNKVGTVVHLGNHRDETGLEAHWHINAAHYMESWTDGRAYDGTVSVAQPMIDPLYGGHSAHDIVQSLLDNPDVSPYAAVRENWSAQTASNGPGVDAEFGWRKLSTMDSCQLRLHAKNRRRQGHSSGPARAVPGGLAGDCLPP